MSAADGFKVWVGCLACYNAGNLRGEWVDAIDAGEFVPCTGRGHEEWWVLDHEGSGGLLTGECSPMHAQELAEQIEAAELNDADELEAFGMWEGDHSEPERFRDEYRGKFDSFRDFVEEWCDEVGYFGQHESPETWERVQFFIDWDSVAREFECGGGFSVYATKDYRVHVFEDAS